MRKALIPIAAITAGLTSLWLAAPADATAVELTAGQCTLTAAQTPGEREPAVDASAPLPVELDAQPARQQLANLNQGFCQTNCGGPNRAPMNFSTNLDLGALGSVSGCGCVDKVPDLLADPFS